MARDTGERVEPAIPLPLRVVAALSWRFLAISAATALLAFIVATLRIIFLPTIVALILATALAPPACWLREHGLPRSIASLTVVLGGIVALLAALTLLGGFVVSDLDEFENVRTSVNEGVDRLAERIADSPLGISEADLSRLVEQARGELANNAGRIGGGAFSGALIVVEVIAGALLMLVLLFFFVSDGRAIWDWMVRLFPVEHQPDAHAMGERAWSTLGGYVRGTAVVALADAVLIGIALLLLGVPFALPLAVLIFVGAFIPLVGAFVSGFAAVMVALASLGVLPAALVLLAIVVVQQVEGAVLQPLVIGRSVALHPVAVLLAVTAGGVVWGIAGAFVAVPLTAVLATNVGYLAARGRVDIAPAVDPTARGETGTSSGMADDAEEDSKGST